MLRYEQLIMLDGKILGTSVQLKPFTVEVDRDRISTVTHSTGRRRDILRSNVEHVLKLLMQRGSMTKDEMAAIPGVSTNKATKLIAILKEADLPGVTFASAPRRLIYDSPPDLP